MKIIKYLSIPAVFLSNCVLANTPDDVDYAIRICTVVESTGMAINCKVNTFSVDITMDTNGTEGKKICNSLSDMMSKETKVFKGSRWQIKIISPYSNGTPIAKCNLNR